MISAKKLINNLMNEKQYYQIGSILIIVTRRDRKNTPTRIQHRR